MRKEELIGIAYGSACCGVSGDKAFIFLSRNLTRRSRGCLLSSRKPAVQLRRPVGPLTVMSRPRLFYTAGLEFKAPLGIQCGLVSLAGRPIDDLFIGHIMIGEFAI